MINVFTLEPCPNCKRSVSMVMPGKDGWYISCTKCIYHTETHENEEDARAEWEAELPKEAYWPELTGSKKKVVVNTPKRGANQALVRERFAVDKDYDSLVEYATTLGFKSDAAAVRYVNKLMKKEGML